MGVHYLLYTVFLHGRTPDVDTQIRLFEEYGFSFSPSGFCYLWKEDELRQVDSDVVFQSATDLLTHPSQCKHTLMANWDGSDHTGFTYGNVQMADRVIGVFEFLGSEIDTIHDYLRARGSSFVRFIGDFYFQMEADVIFGGSDHSIDIAGIVDYLHSATLQKIPIMGDIGFFIAKENCNFFVPNNSHLDEIKTNEKTVWARWPFCEE